MKVCDECTVPGACAARGRCLTNPNLVHVMTTDSNGVMTESLCDISDPRLTEGYRPAKPNYALGDLGPVESRDYTKPPATEPPVVAEPVPHLTTDREARKQQPIASGVLDYFPAALADVARLSKIGNDQHNPGEPLHWSRGKSDDHVDCIMRHLIDRGTVDTDGVLHDTKVAWRALAQLQVTIERLRAQGKY